MRRTMLFVLLISQLIPMQLHAQSQQPESAVFWEEGWKTSARCYPRSARSAD
jgi:hypothetical protein